MAESSQKDRKTLWEKEKLLVASNFSFSHSVFKRPVLQTRKNQGLFGKGLNGYQKDKKKRAPQNTAALLDFHFSVKTFKSKRGKKCIKIHCWLHVLVVQVLLLIVDDFSMLGI